MKQLIKITEEDLHNLVKGAVNKILGEGAFDKYQKDLMDIELDRNMNVDDMNFSTAYAQLDDPMVRKIKGSTMRSMMSDTTGNDITENKLNRIIETTVGDILADIIPDTEGNVYTDSDEFKDWFYPEIKKVLGDNRYNILMTIINSNSPIAAIKQLSYKYGLSTERIRQIYHNSLKTLGKSDRLKNNVRSLLTGDYDKDSMNRINNMKHDVTYSPGSSNKLIYNDLMLAALNVFEYGVEWNGLEPRMHRNQFIQFFKESYVETSEAGLLEFFRKNFNKIFYNNRTGNVILKNFDEMFAPNIKRQYKVFYEKWREMLTAKKRLK